MKILSDGMLVAVFALLLSISGPALAEDAAGYPYPGTHSVKTGLSFGALVESLNAAVKANGMFVVTRASASVGASKRGVTIVGNMIVGVYRNDFAVRMLEASIPSGIEAPLRFYITADADGTATLTYRDPTAVFGTYGSADLDAMAVELDAIWAKIVTDAVK
jgi:uncharacterized protein (DUF302 family)